MNTIFITGVASGIGHGLANFYLDRGDRVLGLSRHQPKDLSSYERFTFVSHDLRDHAGTAAAMAALHEGVAEVDIAILNAGILGSFGDLTEASVDEMKDVMDVNVWANKSVLDALFRLDREISQVVTISSGAAVNGNRGWRGYAISKAALNMLTMLYAAEKPDTHFCALAPGIVDTGMQDLLLTAPADKRFPSLETIRSKRHTDEMPTPERVARRLVETIDRLPTLVESGAFADIRKEPLNAHRDQCLLAKR